MHPGPTSSKRSVSPFISLHSHSGVLALNICSLAPPMMDILDILQPQMITDCCQLVGSLNNQVPEAVFGFQCFYTFTLSLTPFFNQKGEYGVRGAYLKDKPTSAPAAPSNEGWSSCSQLSLWLCCFTSKAHVVFMLALESELDSRDLHCQKSFSTDSFYLHLPHHLQNELCSRQVTWHGLPPPDPRHHSGFLSNSSVSPLPSPLWVR